MSQPEQIPMSNADAIEAHASQWLGRREFGDWTDRDHREFDAWLNLAPEHRIAFVRLETGWARTARLAALRPFSEERKTNHAARSWRSRTRILAGLTVVVVLAVGAMLFQGRSVQTTYSTPIGGHRTIVLADGTLVELNTDTALHARMSAGWRNVQLDHGEAYFQVRHDGARPFIVTAGDHRVVDLGTKFVVRNDSDHLEVALLEGRARFESADAKTQSAILSPGDVVVAKGGALSLTKSSAKELDGDFSWRHGLLVFKHTALADAAAEFNRYNRDKLVVADASAAKLQIRGTFRTYDVLPFANVARDVLGLHVARRGEDIVLTR